MSDQSITGPPNGSADVSPGETAAYIADLLTGLAALAQRKDMMFLAYLIEMAAVEARAEADAATGDDVDAPPR